MPRPELITNWPTSVSSTAPGELGTASSSRLDLLKQSSAASSQSIQEKSRLQHPHRGFEEDEARPEPEFPRCLGVGLAPEGSSPHREKPRPTGFNLPPRRW